MNKWQLMNFGTISILDDMKTINRLCEMDKKDVAWGALQRLDKKIDNLWQFGICSLDHMYAVKYIVKIWAEKKYGWGYLISV